MSALSSRFGKLCGSACLMVFGASGLFASDLVLQKVPPLTVEQAPAYPQNLARYDLGAQVEAEPSKPIASLRLNSSSGDRNSADAALLCHDPTMEYALPAGKTTLLVSLSRIENVDIISFLNRGTKGDLTIATASAKLPADSPQWRKISQQDLTTDSLKVKVGPTEAKYVRLTFDVTEPGRISGLGIYSTAGVSEFTMPRARKIAVADQSKSIALISYNLADLHAHARTLYISSGDDVKQANNMIDDQPATGYSFAAGDVTPTTVVDLGKPTALRRISTIYSARPGRVSFYVLQSLPTSAGGNAPKSLRLDSTAQQNLKPVGSVTDDGTGRASVDFPATTGRYVMVKWDLATRQDASFSVAEIAAFGGGSASGNLMAANASGGAGGRIESDGKDLADAKDAKDIPAEGPESPAEGPPPALPDPPPFTFIPEILPTSP
ncbi:MAG: hypothetical protein QOE73_484 [Verrucomicrobiota bacterium]